jgi:hypothetical protein
VKTLSDPARTKVDYNPIGTQVKFLRSRARPGIPIGTNTPRVSRTEFHTWQVRARPIQAKLEDDNDIHLVISVPTAPSKTMIVEFPKKTCVASPLKRYRIVHARRQFLNNCRRGFLLVVVEARRKGDDHRCRVLRSMARLASLRTDRASSRLGLHGRLSQAIDGWRRRRRRL